MWINALLARNNNLRLDGVDSTRYRAMIVRLGPVVFLADEAISGG
jgi:hypothetical protein